MKQRRPAVIRRSAPLASALAALALLVSATPALAQRSYTPTLETGVAYQYLHGPDSQGYPLGANADITGALFPGLRWVAEIGVAVHRDTAGDIDATATTRALHYGGGLRLAPGQGRLPWVQVVVGAQRDSFSFGADGVGTLISDASSTLMVQPGLGWAVSLGRWRLFAQGDYRRVRYDDAPEGYYRGLLGLRVRLQ